jgi:hypothetical protein
MAVLAIDVRKERGIVEAGLIFERDKLHRLPFLGRDALLGEEPADHRDVFPHMLRQVLGGNMGNASEYLLKEIQRMTPQREAEQLQFVRELLLY